MKSEKTQRHGVELLLGEHGQVVGAAQDDQRTELTDQIGEGDGHADAHEKHHEHREALVDGFEELVQDHDEDNEEEVGNKPGQDAEAISRRGRGDVMGRGRSVTGDQESGEHELPDDGNDRKDKVHETSSMGGRFHRIHALPPGVWLSGAYPTSGLAILDTAAGLA